MSPSRSIALLGLCAGALGVTARAADRNFWPVWNETSIPGNSHAQVNALGPLFFHDTKPDGQSALGVRPLLVVNHAADGKSEDVHVLYPLLSYHSDPDMWRLSLFSILRATGEKGTHSGAKDSKSFEVWPFYFSRDDAEGGDHYKAVFPIYGDITHRFGEDVWKFRLFPLYSRSEKNGRITTKAPWPFLRFINGNGHHGFEFWPLFGNRARAGDYHSQFYLWPFIYKSETHLDQPVPSVSKGFLPFYAATDSAAEKSRTYVWPFFGYTDRTEPYKYHQTNYLWPLLVQGRGDDREVNRWAPFYTHSVVKGRDKTWIAWPVWNHTSERIDNVLQTESRVGLVIFKSTRQTSLTNPSAPAAQRTHLWPLLSSWNNGAGRKQLQVLSPLEPLFADNPAIRQTWSPLFAVYRYNQSAPGLSQHSLLWNLVTYKKEPERKEFHLGPLFSTETGPEARVAFGAGLIGVAKGPDGHWNPFLFHFKRRAAATAGASSPP